MNDPGNQLAERAQGDMRRMREQMEQTRLQSEQRHYEMINRMHARSDEAMSRMQQMDQMRDRSPFAGPPGKPGFGGPPGLNGPSSPPAPPFGLPLGERRLGGP